MGSELTKHSAIEAFRSYLTLVANKELAPDLAAKVGASDLVQETFLAAVRDMSRFNGSSPTELRRWLKGILRNLLSNTRRQYRGTLKRRLDLEVSYRTNEEGIGRDCGATVLMSVSATSASTRAIRHERATALREALAVLPEHYRQVIQWRQQDRLPFEVIASRLGVSPDAARKTWGRALLRLREALGADHDPR